MKGLTFIPLARKKAALEVVNKLIVGLPEAPRTTEVHAESSTVSTCLLAIYFYSVTMHFVTNVCSLVTTNH